MAQFDNGVQGPGGGSYSAPLMQFSQFANWAADDPFKKVFDQQQQQLNAQRLQQGQQQLDIAQTFKGGLPMDPATGAIDYRKAVAMLAQKGDVGALWNGADAMLSQSATLSPMFGGGSPGSPQPQPAGPQGQPTSIPARPLSPPAANSPQGDAGQGTIASIVTDRLPNQDATTGQTIGKIASTMGVDPNANLTPGQLRRAQGLLQRYAPPTADAGGGQGGSPDFKDRFAAAGGGALPPSANAVSPAPPAAAPARPQQAAPASAATPQPAPIGAGMPQGAPQAPQPQQASAPLVPQVRLPNDPSTGKPFQNPQDAILAMDAEMARLSRNPKNAGQIALLKDWRDRIEKMSTPIEMRQGTTMVDPKTGQALFTAPSAAAARNNPQIVSGIAEGIASGQQPPTLTGLYSMSGPVRAALQEKGFDLSKAQLEYDRAKKQISSLNGPQMTRFVGLATSVDRTIDEVRELSEQLQNTGVPFYNKLAINGYMKMHGNSPEGQLAARYIGAVNTLKEEFANLAQGGYAPTEAVWKLANEQIDGNYGVKQMGASLDEIQRLIRYRVHAIPGLDTMGPGAANRYTGQTGAPPAAAAAAQPGAGGSTTKWERGPDGSLRPAP